ncbi:MAG: hypothetical protein M4579_000813 [Chaenotheca gracillima]|nr:MAG: hypothetical protein M4579_000813 [Chaenotheca gracillima]
MDASLENLQSARRQSLLLEFASLKHTSLQGVYLSLTPGNPSLWSGVIFVRKGPYARAILRVRITFPSSYPSLPPLVTFATDIFHPLLTPLTTYTYTTGASDSDTVSATDEERLPPGGFSLRHGFPHWFERSRVRAAGADKQGDHSSVERTLGRGDFRPQRSAVGSNSIRESSPLSSGISSRVSRSRDSSTVFSHQLGPNLSKGSSAVDVLRYIRSTFDDENVLDSVPLEAASNPGAWHAWRSHRARLKAGPVPPSQATMSEFPGSEGDTSEEEETSSHDLAGGIGVESGRRPGQWNWEGVWEERVKKGVEGSLAEPILFGNVGGGADLIRFLNMDDGVIDKIKETMFRRVKSDDDR